MNNGVQDPTATEQAMGDEPMDAAEVPDKGKGKMALQDDPMEASEEEESSEDEDVRPPPKKQKKGKR